MLTEFDEVPNSEILIIPCSVFREQWTQLESDHLLKALLRCTWLGEVRVLISALNTNSTKVTTVQSMSKKEKWIVYLCNANLWVSVFVFGQQKEEYFLLISSEKTFKKFFFPQRTQMCLFLYILAPAVQGKSVPGTSSNIIASCGWSRQIIFKVMQIFT